VYDLAASTRLLQLDGGRAVAAQPHPASARGLDVRSMKGVMKSAALLLAVVALLLAPVTSSSQEMLRIAAVVNDDVISLFDVNARIHLLLLTINQPESPEAYRSLYPQVLRTLIDEHLELQEAKAKGIDVTDSEVDQAVAEIEANNRMPAGGLFTLLAQNRIPKETMISQLRSRLAWQRTVARRLRLTYQVTAEQIDEALVQIKADQGKPEYLLAEIFLGIDNPDLEPDVRANAQRMVTEVKQGADFAALARQFSESATSAAGGDLGWVQLNQLDPEIGAAVDTMQIGSISAPIRTVTGYHVLWLRERRTNAAPNPDDAKVTLRRIVVPMAANAPAADADAKKQAATKAAASIKSCDDTGRVATELGAAAPTDLGALRIADLAPRVQPMVAKLAVGQATEPIALDNGLAIMVVCDRADPAAATLPDRDAVAQHLLAEKLDGESRKYLRDLRQAAYIDIRA
jgi:peptidyl-prolyl cis-trans isomerase SurA